MGRFFSFILHGAVLITLVIFESALVVAEEGCDIAKSAIEIAEKIRGLSIQRKVPCKLQDRGEIESYIREAIAKKIPVERLKGEERTYKLIGLLELNYDYTEGLIQLYTGQLGGYYDAEEKFYAMAAWMPAVVQMPIAVHELTHALQDQHFDLVRFLDDCCMWGDPLLARTALVEGDATAVMLDYMRKLQGQGSIAQETNVSAFIVQNLIGTMFSPGLNAAPPVLQAVLIFPYVSGLNFTHRILREDGYAGVNDAYKNPPRSTEEILHPDKYGKPQRDFEEIDIPRPPAEVRLASPEPVFAETEGEFIISVLLRTYLPVDASLAASSGWGGDRIALYDRAEKRVGDLGVVVWETAWDSDRDAEEFFAALTEAYRKRYQLSPEREGNRVTFRASDLGETRLRRDGRRVHILVGF